ncbi:MAG: hypothetical protein ACKOT0_00390 [bacterium]
MPVVIGAFGGTASFPTGPNADDSIQVTVPTGTSLFVGGLNSEATRFIWLTEITGSGNYPTSILTMGHNTPTIDDDTILVAGTLFGAGATYFPVGPNSDDSIALPGTASRFSSFVGAVPPGQSYFAWVTHVTGAGNVRVQSAALRPHGELMLVGNFDGSASFPTSSGQISVSAPGGTSVFVAQMARDDTGFEWVQPLHVRLGGGNSEVTVAGGDTPIIAGGVSGTMSFPTTSDSSIALTTTFGTSKYFVAALNRDDSYIAWVQSIAGTSGNNYLTSVQAPQTGRTLLTGYFEGSLTVPTGPGDDSTVLTSNGASDMFVASLNSDDTAVSSGCCT